MPHLIKNSTFISCLSLFLNKSQINRGDGALLTGAEALFFSSGIVTRVLWGRSQAWKSSYCVSWFYQWFLSLWQQEDCLPRCHRMPVWRRLPRIMLPRSFHTVTGRLVKKTFVIFWFAIYYSAHLMEVWAKDQQSFSVSHLQFQMRTSCPRRISSQPRKRFVRIFPKTRKLNCE